MKWIGRFVGFIVVLAMLITFAGLMMPLLLLGSAIAYWHFTREAPNKEKATYAKYGIIVSSVGVLFFLGSSIFSESPEVDAEEEQVEVVEEEEVEVEEEEIEEDEEVEVEKEPEPEPEVVEIEVTREQKNALGSAENYLALMNFSEEGLRGQLEYEEYPTDAIDYALDNVIVDYFEQALGSAKAYQKLMPMSDGALKDQLIFEGYTSEQAQYAIENLE